VLEVVLEVMFGAGKGVVEKEKAEEAKELKEVEEAVELSRVR
jgi:hypothetical protein